MPPCFTCGVQITFDDKYRSKNGKRIPLWPDKQNAHGHDDQGKAIRQPLPLTQEERQPPPLKLEQQYQQQQQQQQQQPIGRPSMQDVMLNQISQKLDQIKSFLEPTLNEKVEACYQLCKSNNDMLGAIVQSYKITEPTTASELYGKMQHTKQEALKTGEGGGEGKGEVHGWDSVPNYGNSYDDQNNDPLPQAESVRHYNDDDDHGDNKDKVDAEGNTY